jgi:hypothetical protein
MKLFLYDEKHHQVYDMIDLGELSNKEIILLQKVAYFLGKNAITDRYKSLVVADSYTQTYPEDESEIEWDGAVVM